MKREFVMLAKTFEDTKHHPIGWYLSTKLDGMRCFYDGGASRGLRATDVPWANIEKDHIKKNPVICTGLWSRYANVIHAPDEFVDALPEGILLDGELYSGRGSFQQLVSTTKKYNPDSEAWKSVKYCVFDCPNVASVFQDGLISNANFKKNFIGCVAWHLGRVGKCKSFYSFIDSYNYLCNHHPELVHAQVKLESIESLYDLLDRETALGGEGIMLRRPLSTWTPERSHDLLKVKRMQDAEGTVVSYVWGKETDKGSKLLGLMGSLRLRFNDVEFDLSGFTEAERIMVTDLTKSELEARYIGASAPGETVKDCHNPKFPIGSKVTFKYRELTNDGLPKEARFFRVYNGG